MTFKKEITLGNIGSMVIVLLTGASLWFKADARVGAVELHQKQDDERTSKIELAQAKWIDMVETLSRNEDKLTFIVEDMQKHRPAFPPGFGKNGAPNN